MPLEPPMFSGRDPLGEPIHDFFEKLELYFAIKNTPLDRRWAILDALIKEPAKRAYDIAITNPGINMPIQGDENAQNQAHTARYAGRKNWLLAQYHTAREQRVLRTVVGAMKQNLSESPRAFYNRLAIAAYKAGYAEAAIPAVLESAFL